MPSIQMCRTGTSQKPKATQSYTLTCKLAKKISSSGVITYCESSVLWTASWKETIPTRTLQKITLAKVNRAY